VATVGAAMALVLAHGSRTFVFAVFLIVGGVGLLGD